MQQEPQRDPREPQPRRRTPRLLIGVPVALAVVLAVVVATMLNGAETSSDSRTRLENIVPASANNFLSCTQCHGNLDLVFDEGRLPNLTFTHAKHFSIGVSDCGACHVGNTHERDRINAPTMLQCSMCHGLSKSAMAPGSCVTCHPADMPGEPASHAAADWVPVRHAKLAKESSFDCLTCHRQSSCDSCHGLQLPHPSGWDRAHPATYFKDPTLCERCHPVTEPASRDFCDSCHHPQGPDNVSWRAYHPTAVKQATAANCFQCHAEQTCTICHRSGRLDLSADQQLLLATPSPALTSAASASAGG
jgi:doubled CXXCH motif protein